MSESFWEWSLRVYAQPRVEALLLELQDRHGLDVNLILWRIWCSIRFEEPPEFVLRKAAEIESDWGAEILHPLRQVRRALKKGTPAADKEIRLLRNHVKDAELAAENIVQDRLERLANEQLTPSPATTETAARARRALASYTRSAGAATSGGFSVSLLEELIELTLAAPESVGESE